jgi:predicted nucleic acid-binding protein
VAQEHAPQVAAVADVATFVGVGRYVIDAVTLVHLVDSKVRVDPSHQLVAPTRIRSEALELLLADVQRGARQEKDALALHTQMTELKIRLLGDRMSRGTAWKIARERGWPSLRDAEYLSVTRLQADALVTLDPALAAAADGVVPVAPVERLLSAD